jgi:hypothetical protein
MEGMGFTPLDLERFLTERVAYWVNNPPIFMRNPEDPLGDLISPVVYQGRIPSTMAGPEMQNVFKAPAIAVACTNANYKRPQGKATVHIAILTWDDNNDRNGYQDVHLIIQRIVSQLYMTGGVLGDSFILTDDEVDTEVVYAPEIDFFGYFIGSITAHFGMQTPILDEGPVIGQEEYLIS